jgi:hypothetical protein
MNKGPPEDVEIRGGVVAGGVGLGSSGGAFGIAVGMRLVGASLPQLSSRLTPIDNLDEAYM